MNENDRSDETVRAWVRSGPEQVSAEFVERTLRPVPRMRQRRSWRIVAERAARPALALVAAVAIVGLVAVGIRGLGGIEGVGAPVPTSSPGVARPAFTLTLTGGPGAGTYTADPATSLDQCTHTADGSWRFLYAGGSPFWNIDVLVVPAAAGSTADAHVAAEIEGPGYVRFDPAILRGGDPPGRSTADVAVTADSATTTFVISATTPDRTTGTDGAPVTVDLTLVCPN